MAVTPIAVTRTDAPVSTGESAPAKLVSTGPNTWLASIRKTAKAAPRVLVLGAPKTGKSRFASGAPNVVFLGPEEGGNYLQCEAFPAPTSWQEVIAQTKSLDCEHSYKWLAIDTIDWLEPLLIQSICLGGRKETLREFGYGEGDDRLTKAWREYLSILDRLRARGIGIIALAHATLRTVDPPDGKPYDRWELKTQSKRTAAIWCEYSDHILRTHVAQVVDDGKPLGDIKHRIRCGGTIGDISGSRAKLERDFPNEWQDFARQI